ncbi:MAG: FG-GAP repeat protein [Planctomycetes bacterium]|nr:FG-GAP repeat protein [Planctomycetota bacterium]
MRRILGTIFLVCTIAGSTLAQSVIDKIHHHENTMFGGSSYFGASVARVGDLQADGSDDFVVGCPGYEDYEFFYIGKAFLWYTHNGTDSQGGEFTGEFDTGLGQTVAGIGDVNGDGIPDAIIAYGNYDKIIVISGNGALLYIISSPIPNDTSFGRAVLGPGDLDHDGLADIVVSAIYGGPLGAGAVYAFHGTNGALLYTVEPQFGADLFGLTLGRLGDINGDGSADFIVGAPGSLVVSNGYIQIISGIDGRVLYTYLGGTGERLGSAVAGGGDVNKDGSPDFLISAPGAAGGGVVRLYSGTTKALIATTVSPAAGAAYVLDWLGDIDGDGADDWACDSYSQVSIFSGAQTGQSGEVLETLQGSYSFGYSFSSAHDLNGDGLPDLIIGEPDLDNVWLYSLLPHGVSYFGKGTPGCAGANKLASGQVPYTSNAYFTVNVNHGTPNIPGLVLAGNVFDSLGNDFFGVGVICYINFPASTELYDFTLLTDAQGFGSAPIPIPNDPGLSGKQYILQAYYAFVPGCTSSNLTFSSSNALILTIP